MHQSGKQIRVLVVDSDPQMRRAMQFQLQRSNFDVYLASSGEEALDQADLCLPQVILLDLELRSPTGFDVCRQLRDWSNAPLIGMSSRDNEAEKVALLDLGADDFLVKPFGMNEMMARVRAILRRSIPEARTELSVFSCDGLRIDFEQRLVKLNGCEVHLTPKEYSLLRYLVMNTNRVLTSRQLSTVFAGNSSVGESHTLRVHVANFRKKLEVRPESPRFIITETGIGYKFTTSKSEN